VLFDLQLRQTVGLGYLVSTAKHSRALIVNQNGERIVYNVDFDWKPLYIPEAELSKIETELDKKPALRRPIYTVEEIGGDKFLCQVCNVVFDCIGSITAKFPDGPTYFALSSSEVPAALIAKFGGFQCIVVSHSAVRLCHDFAKIVFQDDDLIQFVISGRDVEDRFEPITRTRKEAVSAILSKGREDTDRACEWADLLASLASYFIVAHEIGHLACDHFSDRDSLSIVENDNVAGDMAVARRADEWQADSFAVIATLYQHIRIMEGESRPRDTRFPDRLSAYRFSLILAYIIFTVMDLENSGDIDYSKNSHPAPLARAGLTAVSLMQSSLYTTTIDQPQALELARLAFKAIEICIGRAGGGMLTAEEIERYGGEAEESLMAFCKQLDHISDKRDLLRWSHLSWTEYLFPKIAQD